MSSLAETGFAKLNLALHVRERMPDGYHRIETIFAFCDHGDRLDATPADDLSLELGGPFAGEIAGADNLVLRAAAALREAARTSEGAALSLFKTLPVAGGLGGGSADAAATLRLLNRLWSLNWTAERLEAVARPLGADVPACVHSHSLRGDGRGDDLEPVELGLAGTPVLLVNPRLELPTSEVFAGWDGVDRGPLGDWRAGRNDLEPAAADLSPLVGTVLAWLGVQPGADVVRMSGSGSTCFAIFDSVEKRDKAAVAVPREWWRMAAALR